MYRFRAPRLAARRLAALLTLALAAACGDGVTNGRPTPGRPGGGTPPDTATVVASVEITPGTLQLRVDSSRALSATVRSQRGEVLQGRLLSWSSSDPSVVRIDINGNATALKVGTSVITASLDGRQGQSTIEVLPPPAPPAVHAVWVTSESAAIEPGESLQLAVQLRSATGETLYNRAVTWTSSDSTVVRLLPGGQVLGLKGGTATITATSEGKSGSITFVIPQWLQFDLVSASGQTLPRVLELSADTVHQSAEVMIVDEYRLRLVWGRLWISTIDSGYRQRYEVQTWKKSITHFQGNTITGPEELVQSRTIRDEGRAEMYDVWTGEPIYESTLFGGHSFRASRTLNRGRSISQRLPGEGGETWTLIFNK